MNSHNSIDINKLAMCFLLRIPAIHGAKTTKIRPPWYVLLDYFTTQPSFQLNPKRICTPILKMWLDVIMERGNGRLVIQALKTDM